MRVAREEIFGPVLSVIPFESEEDLIRLLAYVKSLPAPQTAGATPAQPVEATTQPVEPAANAGTPTSTTNP